MAVGIVVLLVWRRARALPRRGDCLQSTRPRLERLIRVLKNGHQRRRFSQTIFVGLNHTSLGSFDQRHEASDLFCKHVLKDVLVQTEVGPRATSACGSRRRAASTASARRCLGCRTCSSSGGAFAARLHPPITSATGGPVSAYFNAYEICSSVHVDFFIASSFLIKFRKPEISHSNAEECRGRSNWMIPHSLPEGGIEDERDLPPGGEFLRIEVAPACSLMLLPGPTMNTTGSRSSLESDLASGGGLRPPDHRS